MTWVVYVLRDPRTGEVRYVGETQGHRDPAKSAQTRLVAHLAEARRGFERKKVKPKDAWILSLGAAGLPVVLSVVDHYPARPDHLVARAIERHWIEAHAEEGHRLFNVRMVRVPKTQRGGAHGGAKVSARTDSDKGSDKPRRSRRTISTQPAAHGPG